MRGPVRRIAPHGRAEEQRVRFETLDSHNAGAAPRNPVMQPFQGHAER